MKSRKIAFGAIVCAASLVLMLLCGVIPVGVYALPCLAGMLLMYIVTEFGTRWAIGVYISTALLSLLLVSDKEAVLNYILILGIYPILKSFFEKPRFRKISVLLKLLYFNAAAVAVYFLSIYVLSVPAQSFLVFGSKLPLVLLAFGNVVFIVYDICLTRIISRYINGARHRFKF